MAAAKSKGHAGLCGKCHKKTRSQCSGNCAVEMQYVRTHGAEVERRTQKGH